MKNIITLAILSSLAIASFAQNTYQRTVGGLRNTIMVPTSDSGYLMVASMELVTVGQDEVVIQKTDANGVPQWIKAYGSTYNERIFSGVEHNGYYYLCGKRTSSTDTTGIILKLSLTGNFIWSKTLDYTRVFTDIVGLSDGNLGVTGAGKIPSSTTTDMMTIKIDTAGLMIWSVSPELNGINDTACAVIEYGQGGLLTVGTSFYLPGIPNGVYYANNAAGTFAFKKTYANSSLSDVAMANGDIYIGGMNMNVDDYLLLIRVNLNTGDTLSTITFGNFMYHKNVVNMLASPFGFWFTGNAFNQNAYATLIDPSGAQVWSKEIVDPVAVNEKVYNCVHSTGGRITFGGYTETGAAIPNAWIISGTESGNFGCNTSDITLGWWHVNEPHTFSDILSTLNHSLASDTVQMPLRSVAIMDNFICTTTVVEEQAKEVVNIYPVPATGVVTVTATTNIGKVDVVSMNGDVVLSVSGSNTNKIDLNCAGLSNGVYFARITTEDNATTITRLLISE